MIGGAADHYDLISRAANPEEEIAALPREMLVRLHDYVARLPDSGFPAVVKASIADECRVRYLQPGGGR